MTEIRTDTPSTSRAKEMFWVWLLKRVFSIDIEQTQKCGGKIKIMAGIEDPEVVEKITSHSGIPLIPPRLRLERWPPPDDRLEIMLPQL